jgi:hypothetical protein
MPALSAATADTETITPNNTDNICVLTIGSSPDFCGHRGGARYAPPE